MRKRFELLLFITMCSFLWSIVILIDFGQESKLWFSIGLVSLLFTISLWVYMITSILLYVVGKEKQDGNTKFY